MIEQMRQRGSDWVTSREIACEVGYPYQGVARALLRLAACKTLDAQETAWVSSRFRVRRCHVFRLVEVKAEYPTWLMPPAPPVVVGSGRVIRMED